MPNDASRASLNAAVNNALDGNIMIADDALTDSNILIIEKGAPRTAQGRLATGRNMDMPVQFKLVMSDSTCVLIDTRNDTRYPLSETDCVAN